MLKLLCRQNNKFQLIKRQAFEKSNPEKLPLNSSEPNKYEETVEEIISSRKDLQREIAESKNLVKLLKVKDIILELKEGEEADISNVLGISDVKISVKKEGGECTFFKDNEKIPELLATWLQKYQSK